MQLRIEHNETVAKSGGKFWESFLRVAFWLGLRHAVAITTVGILALPVALRAQTGQGSIGGTVHDPRGDAIPHAVIDVVSDSTGVQQRTVANDEGAFRCPRLTQASTR